MRTGNPILVQAPTGLGKTVGVLHPVLEEALGRGQKVVYVTPKNSQHAVAEDAVLRFQQCGSPIRALSLTAKRKICPKNEPVCTPDSCEYARNEAHNLPSRGMDYHSPALSTVVLERMREEILQLPPVFRRVAEELLDGCIRTVASCGGSARKPVKIAPPVELFLAQESKLRLFLPRYLEGNREMEPEDVFVRLAFSWSEFTDSLQLAADPSRDEFFTTFHPHGDGGTVKITCCDPSEFLRDCYAEYEQVVAFSATLKPFEYYARLSGLDPEKVLTMEFSSPFPRELRKLLVIPQISTKYAHRERNYGKIAETVERIAAVRPGNYFVFFPSFDFLDRVARLFRPPPGFAVRHQERGATASAIEEILLHLRTAAVPTLVFAVQGGSFAEGIDCAGETVVGAFVVGPPLPTYNLEREEMREYYGRRYGAGFEYAYTIPAMAKAVQAAGRVIRSETDRGLVVLMDARFTDGEYSRAMPSDWFEADIAELVSGSILKEVAEFWSRIDG